MTTIERDGMTLAYDEKGSGGPPMLLLHGMACDRITMQGQFEHFGRSRRTVAYDHRGHGESDKPVDAAYDPASLADDAYWLCQALGLERPVVVGHSLGGTIALALVAEHPELASALVMLDSVMEMDEVGREGLGGFYDALSEKSFDRILRAFVHERLFDAGDDPVAAERIVDVMTSCPLPIFVGMGRGLLEFDLAAAVAAVQVPTLYVAASRPWFDLADLRRARPDWFLGRTVGAGHFHNLLVANQVNGMIEAFLGEVDAGRPAAPAADF